MLRKHVPGLLQGLADLAAEALRGCAIDCIVDHLTLRHDRWNKWVSWNYRHGSTPLESKKAKVGR
jgi:hypothetical protein